MSAVTTEPGDAAAVTADAPLLEVSHLSVAFGRRGQTPVTAVDDVSFSLRPGQHVGIVGESGSGKSVTSLAIMGLLPSRGAHVTGSVRYAGEELLTMSDKRRSALRGKEVAMVFQDPMSSLNPVVTVGRQVAEVGERHQGLSKKQARERSVELLATVGIPDPRRRAGEYPHQLSGGMRQRVLIAIALASEPRVLIADEPTTALDVTIQAQILQLLRNLVEETGTALVMITHDLGVVAGLCEQVHVMYSGRIVESAPRRPLFAAPSHPYTGGLLASIPRLDSDRDRALQPIPGSPTDTLRWSEGCAFAPRCAAATEECRTTAPSLDVHGGRSVACFHPLDGAPPSGVLTGGSTTEEDDRG